MPESPFSFSEAIASGQPMLTEGAVMERLRRETSVSLHDRLAHSLWVNDPAGRTAMQSICDDYLNLALQYNLPMVVATPTWRASRSRLSEAGITDDINARATQWLQGVCRPWQDRGARVVLAGMLGPEADCYQPEHAPARAVAADSSEWQARRLAAAGVDILVAATLPAVEEAVGVARAMAGTGLPYVISFVIHRDGCVLDQTPLADAIRCVDDAADPAPLGFMVNCAYPSFLSPVSALSLNGRLIGFQANGSDLDHDQLDAADQLHQVPDQQWVADLMALRQTLGVSLLGGCCGTGTAHIESLAKRLQTAP